MRKNDEQKVNKLKKEKVKKEKTKKIPGIKPFRFLYEICICGTGRTGMPGTDAQHQSWAQSGTSRKL